MHLYGGGKIKCGEVAIRKQGWFASSQSTITAIDDRQYSKAL